MATGMRNSRFLFIVSACIFGVMVAALPISFLAQRVLRQRELLSWCRNTTSVLQSKKDVIPPGITRDKWFFMIDWTGIGIPNCFSNVDYLTDKNEFMLFQNQLSRRLQEPMDEELIDWIWDEMKATSSIGADGYVDRFRPTGDAFENGIRAYR
jgi:hypothetical protein